ncbi:hypothetical protein ElyMa_004960300 [Elysia marginata]|uniref:Ion transport domain-containing protein n=1 Tax=Elysia marginata TaxID=1093978 RepID=A0AAV4J401_9GAST|nr:hypothetical protein ElyMa_004960300 [Elysia marginata]
MNCTLFILTFLQVFDIVVVVVTLGAELTCHFVDMPWKPLYTVKYIVLLRLWRIPFVCGMKAQQVRDSLEQDIDNHRSSQQKAEEKCTQLEKSLSQQAEIIRQLEGALQTFTNERDVASYELNPLELRTTSRPSPLPRKTIPGATQLRRSLLRRSNRKEHVNVMETEFGPGPDVKGQEIIRKTSLDARDGGDKGDLALPTDQGFVSDAHDGDDVFVENGVENILDTSEFQLRPKSNTREATLLTKRTTSPRRKTRRSSTSEYIDYARLTSSFSERQLSIDEADESSKKLSNSGASKNKNSNANANLMGRAAAAVATDGNVGKNLPSGVTSHSSSSASDTSKPSDNSDVQIRLGHPETWSSGGISEDSSGNGDGGSNEDSERDKRRNNKKIRRFSSCPEYAYTQRLTITSDESAFFGVVVVAAVVVVVVVAVAVVV